MDFKGYIEQEYDKRVKYFERLIGHDQTTSNVELDGLGNSEFGALWGGVHARDQVLNSELFNIVNTDVSTGPGQHWVGLAPAERKGYMVEYDSYARPNILQRPRVIMTEDDVEQTIDENNCGQRCLAFLAIVRDHGVEAAMFI